ncbi:MAG: TRAP transporter fused permease subunit [Candidatus Atribacteria bacterium]|jgi:TRAP transporter 4TM/12TM fusion protein|nr:TRAP transporter fused permease subunit [Candidatus Atribacteria bacterium]
MSVQINKNKVFNRTNILFWGGLIFATTQLVLPIFVSLIDLQLRAVHIILGISLALLAYPYGKSNQENEKIFLWDLFLIAVIIVANVNTFFKAMQIYMVPGTASTFDLIIGSLLILVILDAARRSVGWAIPIFVVLLFIYIFVGPKMTGIWRLPGLSWKFVINSVYFSPLGIYGSITGMSATFIAMFIIFGSLISGAGGGKTFIDIALALTGRYRGGPAKTAVVSSALFGSISGSGVANVVVTGNYTIPLMKRLGYNPDFAAGVEAIASTGGGITPPIMSVTAFIMAEFLGLPYLKVIAYALIPCLLYYTGVFAGVHFETIRSGLVAVPESEIPSWKSILTFKKIASLVIPISVLLYTIAIGRALVFAGFYACVAVIIVFLLSDISWSGIKNTLVKIGNGLSEGGIALSKIVPILVAVNILVNMIGITGIAPKLSGLILEVGGNNLILALFIATIIPFILGTSLPVVPTYILSLSILAPSLLRLGVDQIALHLFFIYWAILGGVTPPTCTQAIVAAGIAKSNWFRTALVAVRLGIVAFIIPYFFVLSPALVGRSDVLSVITFTISAFFGTLLLAYGFFGRIKSNLNLVFRVLYIGSGFLLMCPNHILSIIGVAIIIPVFLCQRLIINKLEIFEEK